MSDIFEKYTNTGLLGRSLKITCYRQCSFLVESAVNTEPMVAWVHCGADVLSELSERGTMPPQKSIKRTHSNIADSKQSPTQVSHKTDST